MAKTDWYFAGFILTVIAAGCMWGLAVAVYRNNKKDYLNRTLALTLAFLGLWMLSGFVEKIITSPSNTLTVWTFRWAYAAGIMTSISVLLFYLGLYLNGPPRKRVLYGILSAGILGSVLSLSPYVVQSASYREDILLSQNGPLFLFAVTLILVPAIAGTVLLIMKWHSSNGIDRARTSIVLGSVVLFFPVAAVSTFVLPTIFHNDLSTNFAYLAGVIPVGMTAYAIIRLRLMDVRIILRRTGVFLIVAATLTAPLVALFILLRTVVVNRPLADGIIILVFIILVFLIPAVSHYFRNLSSRLFFSELYDELQLLESVSSSLASHSDLKSGVLSALSEIVYPLCVEKVSVVVPPGVINENSWCLECGTEDNSNGHLKEHADESYRFPSWLNSVNNTVVTEELQRWPKTDTDGQLGSIMASSNLSACVPIKVLSAKVGYVTLGQKVTGRAVSATDISFLEKMGERLGLFIDNYALSAKFGTQLKELKEVYADLHEAYKFKSEIIQVTSHEFRTPITLVNGFALTLKEGWTRLEDEEKLSFLDNIVDACDRITNLTDQFFNVSTFEEGKVRVDKMPVKMNSVIQRLCSTILPDEQERVIIEADPDVYIFTDPEHLHVILKNVLENALRFSPVDQPVLMRAWRNSIHDYIQVRDFGDGIPSDEIERIFEPFVRLESLAHHSKGMGLGLYIVRLLSSRLGIEVEIDCSDGNGTTVTLSVPL